MEKMSRRAILTRASAALGTVTAASSATAKQGVTVSEPPTAFRFCLNTATIRGQDLSLPEQIEVAIAAGYNGSTI